mgnify:CR=1 FL=1
MSSTKSSAWTSASSSRQASPEKQILNHKRIRRVSPYVLTAPFVIYGAYKGIKYLTKSGSKPQPRTNVNFSSLI